MTGYILLHRSITDSPYWGLEPYTKAQALIDLMLSANHSNIEWGQPKFTIFRGQFCTSHIKLAERWRWSRNKIRRFLCELETAQQIVQQSDRHKTIITICNYDEIQTNKNQAIQQKDIKKTSNDTADGTQLINVINESNISITPQANSTKPKTQTLQNDNSPAAPKHLKRVREPLIERADNVWIADFEMAELSAEFGNNDELFYQINAASKWAETNPRKFNKRKSHRTIVKEFRDGKLADGYRFFNHPKLGANYYKLWQFEEFKKGNL